MLVTIVNTVVHSCMDTEVMFIKTNAFAFMFAVINVDYSHAQDNNCIDIVECSTKNI